MSCLLKRECCSSHGVVLLPITQHEAMPQENRRPHAPPHAQPDGEVQGDRAGIVLGTPLVATTHMQILFSSKTETLIGLSHLDVF